MRGLLRCSVLSTYEAYTNCEISHLYNGREGWDWQSVVVEHRESGGIIGLEKHVEADRVLVASSPEDVPGEGFASVQQVVAAEADHVGIVCIMGACNR